MTTLHTMHTRRKRQPRATISMPLLPGGMAIDTAARDAVNMARAKCAAVTMRFNDVALRVLPQQTPAQVVAEYGRQIAMNRKRWRKSTQGKAVVAAQELRQQKAQDAVTAAIRDLPGLLALKDVTPNAKRDMVIGWLWSFVDNADHIGIDWSQAAGVRGGRHEWLALLFKSAGFRQNDCTGDNWPAQPTREHMARYIVGQAINAFRRGRSPHPRLTQKFITEYWALPE